MTGNTFCDMEICYPVTASRGSEGQGHFNGSNQEKLLEEGHHSRDSESMGENPTIGPKCGLAQGNGMFKGPGAGQVCVLTHQPEGSCEWVTKMCN